MKKSCFALVTACLLFAGFGMAQSKPSNLPNAVTRPPSALGRVAGAQWVHTPLFVRIPANNAKFASLTVDGETPAALACIYGLVPPTNGCPTNGTVVPTGGSKAIAVVEYGRTLDRHGNYTLQNDLTTFSTQFGLPSATITEICATGQGSCPSNWSTGWDLETALDVQYAHAMAPNAQIIVVEFANDPFGDGAVTAAGQAVAAAGGGEVSNSWTLCYDRQCDVREDPSELQLDQYMTTPGVVYLASTGDSGLLPAYPSTLPNVIAAGGTQIIRDGNGNFMQETAWWGNGGGISAYEQLPRFQWIISGLAGPFRGTPDISAIADPDDGVDVYSSGYCGGWCVVGGTSVASPVLAGIINQRGSFQTSSSAELTQLYDLYGIGIGNYSKYFRDVTIGSNGATPRLGWDQCTGLGSVANPAAF